MTDRSLRLLFFTQYYPPEVGATQTRMQTFARQLAERGHKVTVVTELPNHPKGVFFEGWRDRWMDRRTEDGVEVIRLRVYTSPDKSFFRRILFYGSYAGGAAMVGSVIAFRSWDAVFATSPPLTAALPGWWTAQLAAVPFVMDVRDLWPAVGVAVGEIKHSWAVRLAEIMERFLYRKAQAVTSVTRSFISHIRDRGANAVHFLPNGTVPELFSPDRTDLSLRQRLGLDDAFVVGYYGNHGVAQGLFTILSAAERLRDRDDVRFVFVGEGPIKDELRREAKDRGLSNVLFHDQVPLDQIAVWINAADIMLVPLADDPIFRQFIPSKLFDYLACATPVLLSVDGEARQILDASGGGFYIPPEDPEVLAQAVRELARGRSGLEEMGRKGREHILDRYTRERQVARLETLLDRLTRQ